MRVVVSAVGSSGNAFPFLGIARELLRRNHEVVVLSEPSRQRHIEALGARFFPILSFDSKTHGNSQRSGFSPLMLRRMAQDQAGLFEEVYNAFAEHVVPSETVMVAASWIFGARIAREQLGAPLVSVAIQPLALPSDPSQYPWLRRFIRRNVMRLIDFRINRLLRPLRKRLGLPPVRNIMDQWSHSPDVSIAMFPEWFAPLSFQGPVRAKAVGFPLYDGSDSAEMSAAARQFLEAGAPPVVLAQSTMGSGEMRDFFQKGVAAVNALGCRAILLSSNPQAIPESLPPNVGYFGFIPVSQILKQAVGFVHHGGLGMISQGLRAGVPQLTVPGFLDQPDNARHLQALGISENIPRRKLTTSAMQKALHRLLTDQSLYHECQRFAKRMATSSDTFSQAADIVEAQLRPPVRLLVG